MKVWQIATGETGRDYREIFFDYDIMILGQNDRGSAKTNVYKDSTPNSKKYQVHSFAFGPNSGDRVIMRFGHEVIGIGQIPQGDEHQYSYEEAFRCVYGWNLPHCRRVIWADQVELGELADVYREAKQKPSFTQVHEKHILSIIESIDQSNFSRPLKTMPSSEPFKKYSDEELGIELFQAGISNRNIDDILKALEQAERLWAWYQSNFSGKNRPTEHEVVSHMVLPLFLGLGWSHQQVAVEWNKIDMAFFRDTPTTEDNCVMVLEAKGLGQGLSTVLEQPINYVEQKGLKSVKYILTTDGANIFVYARQAGEWNQNPIGYINIPTLQKEYIIPRGINPVKTLVMLQPGLA